MFIEFKLNNEMLIARAYRELDHWSYEYNSYPNLAIKIVNPIYHSVHWLYVHLFVAQAMVGKVDFTDFFRHGFDKHAIAKEIVQAALPIVTAEIKEVHSLVTFNGYQLLNDMKPLEEIQPGVAITRRSVVDGTGTPFLMNEAPLSIDNVTRTNLKFMAVLQNDDKGQVHEATYLYELTQFKPVVPWLAHNYGPLADVVGPGPLSFEDRFNLYMHDRIEKEALDGYNLVGLINGQLENETLDGYKLVGLTVLPGDTKPPVE